MSEYCARGLQVRIYCCMFVKTDLEFIHRIPGVCGIYCQGRPYSADPFLFISVTMLNKKGATEVAPIPGMCARSLRTADRSTRRSRPTQQVPQRRSPCESVSAETDHDHRKGHSRRQP